MRTIGRVINMADELLRDVDKSERAAIAQARHDYYDHGGVWLDTEGK